MALAEIFYKSIFNDSEDLLTSDVFTTFRYLPPHLGIIRFIRSIDDLHKFIAEPDEKSTCEYYFWPLGQILYREPDLLLEFRIGEKIYDIVIEVKYLSGPSDSEEEEEEIDGEMFKKGNQLASQYKDLLHGEYQIKQIEDEKLTYSHKRLQSNQEDRFQVYLTENLNQPEYEFNEFYKRYDKKKDKLYWTNWYSVYDFFSELSKEIRDFPQSLMIHDVLALLMSKSFSSFKSMPKLPLLDLKNASGEFWKAQEE